MYARTGRAFQNNNISTIHCVLGECTRLSSSSSLCSYRSYNIALLLMWFQIASELFFFPACSLFLVFYAPISRQAYISANIKWLHANQSKKHTHKLCDTTGVVPTIILVSPAIVNVNKATTIITVIAFSLEWFISCVMRACLYFWALDSLNAYNKYYYFISLSLFRFFPYLHISNISLYHLDKSRIRVLMNFYQEIHSITLFMVAIKN